MLSYSVKDYHAIESASISIDGLTVLAGVNGSGKSTLFRWLFYLINGMHDFEKAQQRAFLKALEKEINRYGRVFRNEGKQDLARRFSIRFSNLSSSGQFEVSDVEMSYFFFLKQANNDLNNYMQSISEAQKQRIIRFLIQSSMDEEVVISEFTLDECIKKSENVFYSQRYRLEKTLAEHKISDLEKCIKSEYEEYEEIEEMPSSISLSEHGIPLIQNDSFIVPLSINRAIYVDSPMAVSRSSSFASDIWSSFRRLLYEKNTNPIVKEQRITSMIQTIIGGSVLLEEDKLALDQELHFITNNGININLDNAATGIKSFAYLYRLLDNGWLDEETILLIDEPEAHLHPQWIVEFARVLVRIQKELGTKVLIASHNPDMVAAIQAIAQKEGINDRTRFYLAERGRESLNYRFVDKGRSINDIFASFNIAISRIEQYGESVI